MQSDTQQLYREAFSRNLGILTEAEQETLRRSCVAVAGLGGLGGVVAATLARSGIGRYRLADFDDFEVVNFNRQYGANLDTVGRNKAEVMAEVVQSIVPGADVTTFTDPLTPDNLDEFLGGADVVYDALDFWELELRRSLYPMAARNGQYTVAFGPLGFSAAGYSCAPDGMGFDEYFDLSDDMAFEDKMLSFAVGLAPAGFHLGYMDPSKIDLGGGAGPSLGIACQVASGMAATEVLNILLDRRPIRPLPHYYQFDPYLMKYKRGRLLWGNRNPIQRFKMWYVRRILDQGKTDRKRSE